MNALVPFKEPPPPKLRVLTSREEREFIRLEAIVAKGLHEAGDALWAIYQKGFWRSKATCWGEYCGERWGHSSSWSYKIKDLGKTRSLIRECSNTEQAQVIGNLPEKVQQDVWNRASRDLPKGQSPTGSRLKEALASAIREEEESEDESSNPKPKRTPLDIENDLEKKIQSMQREIRKHLPEKAPRLIFILDQALAVLRG